MAINLSERISYANLVFADKKNCYLQMFIIKLRIYILKTLFLIRVVTKPGFTLPITYELKSMNNLIGEIKDILLMF